MIDLIDVTAGYRNRPIIKNFSFGWNGAILSSSLAPMGREKVRCCGLWQAFLPINRGMRHLDGKDYERYSRRLFPSA